MSEEYIRGQISAKEDEITRIEEDASKKDASAEAEIEEEFDPKIVEAKAKVDEEEGLRDEVKIMFGGAPVTDGYAEQIGADGYAPDAAVAVKKARELLNRD